MTKLDKEVDILVLGSGSAGLTAALVGALQGCSVMLCEKTTHVGGTTALSGGEIWIPGNARKPGGSPLTDLDAAAQYMEIEAAQPQGLAQRQAYLKTAGEAINYLEMRSEVRFRPVNPHPDYHQDNKGASVGGRPMATVEFDGRRLGRDFSLLRAPRPDFMALGGMMVSRDDIPVLTKPFTSLRTLIRATQLVGRYLLDRLRYPRGTRLVMGNALVARLLYSLRRHNVEIAVESRLVGLILDNGRVVGAEIMQGNKTLRVGARKGVVLATGGFPSDPAMREQYFGSFQVQHSLGFEENVGDGLNAAIGAGGVADLSARTPAAWMPASVMHWKSGRVAVFPHIRDRAKPGCIIVNTRGDRFVNESSSYQDVSLAMFEQQKGDPTVPAYLVCDHRFLSEYGIGIIKPLLEDIESFVTAGYLIRAASIEALAERIGAVPAQLRVAIAAHNRDAATGVDTAFGKGGTAYNRHYGDSAVGPNPCLRAIEVGPFYAVAMTPAPIGSFVGIAADENAGVLGADGTRVPGLYACGNDMAAISRGAYPGPGSTIGPAMVFAYRAVMDMVRPNDR